MEENRLSPTDVPLGRAAAIGLGVGGRDLLRRVLVALQPIAEWQVIDHVHHLELEPARLPGIAVPKRHHAALSIRIEQDQGAIAADAAAVSDDAMTSIIVAAPPVAVPGGPEPF